MVQPSTNPICSRPFMLVILVMLLLLLLLLLQGTGWLLVAMADPPTGKTAENSMLGSVAAMKLLRRLRELSGCSICSSVTSCGKSSSSNPDHCEVVQSLGAYQLSGSFGESCWGY